MQIQPGVTEEEILAAYETAVPNSTKRTIKFGLVVSTSTYMLFAGWEDRIVKNCDRGLENTARGRKPRTAFSSPRSQFFTIRTDSKPANNMFIYFFLQ